jgi:hypothetical protein
MLVSTAIAGHQAWYPASCLRRNPDGQHRLLTGRPAGGMTGIGWPRSVYQVTAPASEQADKGKPVAGKAACPPHRTPAYHSAGRS